MSNTTLSINLDEIPEAMTRSQLQKFTGVAFKTLNTWVDRGWVKVGQRPSATLTSTGKTSSTAFIGSV